MPIMSRVSHPDCPECGDADDVEKLFERWWCAACEICIDKQGEEIEEPECEKCEDDGDVEVEGKCWNCTYEDCLHGLDSKGRIIPECQVCEDYQDVGYKNGSLWCEHCKIDIVDRTEEEQDIKERMDKDPEIRLTEYLDRMRAEFEGTWEAEQFIYVLKVSPEARRSEAAINNRKFPKGKEFPRIVKNPIGFVYVGVTGLSDGPEERFEVHASRTGKASKIAKLGFLYSYDSFEECGSEMTEEYGFSRVGWRDQKALKLESWLAWAFYKAGYWVWGSHLHGEEEFLGEKPFW